MYYTTYLYLPILLLQLFKIKMYYINNDLPIQYNCKWYIVKILVIVKKLYS